MDMDMNMITVMIISHHPQLRHRFFTLAKNVMILAPKYAATIGRMQFNGEQLTQLSTTITNIFISKNITAKTQAAIAMVMAATTTAIWV